MEWKCIMASDVKNIRQSGPDRGMYDLHMLAVCILLESEK